MAQPKASLSFTAQISGSERDLFERAASLLGLPTSADTAAAIAREALLEWSAWLDNRAQFPPSSEMRRARAVSLFGRVSPLLPTREQVRRAFPAFTSRQAANLIAYLADSEDPVYGQRLRTQLKGVLSAGITKQGKSQGPVSLWIDRALAPMLQSMLDEEWEHGHLSAQLAGRSAERNVHFAAMDLPAVQHMIARL